MTDRRLTKEQESLARLQPRVCWCGMGRGSYCREPLELEVWERGYPVTLEDQGRAPILRCPRHGPVAWEQSAEAESNSGWPLYHPDNPEGW